VIGYSSDVLQQNIRGQLRHQRRQEEVREEVTQPSGEDQHHYSRIQSHSHHPS